jgi:RNA polymerase sigma factor (TIGR02999 family)
MSDVTRWLNASGDDPGDEMFAELYAELKRIARSRMQGERPEHTLNATALVHEAWIRLEKGVPEQWQNRSQFYGIAAEAMRRILVESARRRLSRKRGGGEAAVPLDEEALAVQSLLPDDRLLEVHEVLDRLEAGNEILARVIKLRFFGGLRIAEIAALMELSERTVLKHLGVAKVRLFRALEEEN